MILQTEPPRQSPCSMVADSVEALVRVDPKQAIELGRRLLRSCANASEALFRAGRTLNRAVRGEGWWSHNPTLEQAHLLLDRAVRVDPNNPAVWLEYGVVLRKEGGVQLDAQRAIQHSLSLAARDSVSLSHRVLAEIHFERALYLQFWLDRTRWLKDGTRLGVSTPACLELGAFCENYVSPLIFNQELADAAPFSSDRTAQDRVIEHYSAAVRLDTTYVEAAERLGRELALGEEWEPLATLAKQEITRSQEVAFFQAVHALALQRQGRYSEADSQFKLAIPRLPDSIRRWYENPPTGLDTIPDYWARTRPMWLAAFDEKQLEYWSRLTYALLALRDREGGVDGPETPQGDALIRYGWPKMITQVERDMAKFLTPAKLRMCEQAQAGCHLQDQSQGRWLFWTYALDEPSFVFEQRPGMRVPRYMRESKAEQTATEMRKTAPLRFESRLAPRMYHIPAQVAQFRDTSSTRSTLAFFAVIPSKLMGLSRKDLLGTGFFLFHDSLGFQQVAAKVDSSEAREFLSVQYEVTVPHGRFAYSLEAWAPSRGIGAVIRDSIRALVWAPDSLQLSDLLIAHNVDAEAESAASWKDLRVIPSRTLTVQPGGSVWTVWEVYGSSAGSDGLTTYQVTLALQDVNRRPLPVRLLRRLGLLSSAQSPSVSLTWMSHRRLATDGRVVEWVAIQLPADAKGAYDLSITVTEERTQRIARAVRRIYVEPE